MAVTEDVYPSGNSIDTMSGNTITTTNVVVASGDSLLVHVTLDAGSDVGMALQCAANSVDADRSWIVHSNGNTVGFEMFFSWDTPPTGTYSVVTRFTSGAGGQNGMGQKVHVIHGSDQSAPTAATPTSGSGTTASITSPSVPTNGLAVTGFIAGSSFSSTNQTTDCNAANGGTAAGGFQAGAISTSAGAQSFTASISGTDWWGALSVVYSPAAGATTFSGLLDESSNALLDESNNWLLVDA